MSFTTTNCRITVLGVYFVLFCFFSLFHILTPVKHATDRSSNCIFSGHIAVMIRLTYHSPYDIVRLRVVPCKLAPPHLFQSVGIVNGTATVPGDFGERKPIYPLTIITLSTATQSRVNWTGQNRTEPLLQTTGMYASIKPA